MNYSVAEQFVILVLNPEKGRISIDGTHFRYSLTGAILMDFFEGEELKVEDKRVIPSLRINSDAIHTLFAEQISRSSRNRKISYWINRLTRKYRFIFSELTKSLEMRGVLRIEHKKFLGIIPYKKYWILNIRERTEIIDQLRGILLYSKKPAKKELMLITILHAARAHSILSRERGETRTIRQKCKELLKNDLMSTEITQTLREVQVAIEASITAAVVAAQGAH
jgi:golgi phosphoprotein 3